MSVRVGHGIGVFDSATKKEIFQMVRFGTALLGNPTSLITQLVSAVHLIFFNYHILDIILREILSNPN